MGNHYEEYLKNKRDVKDRVENHYKEYLISKAYILDKNTLEEVYMLLEAENENLRKEIEILKNELKSRKLYDKVGSVELGLYIAIEGNLYEEIMRENIKKMNLIESLLKKK